MRIAMAAALLAGMFWGTGGVRAQGMADPHVVEMAGPAASRPMDAHVWEVLAPAGGPVAGLAWPGLWWRVDWFAWQCRPQGVRRS
jgi:hypothetical protein